MVALIGASGSGKSTLLRHLAGLVTADASQNQILFCQKEIQRNGSVSSGIRALRGGIGLIFQQFNLVGRLSVFHNVLLGALGRTPLWRSLLMRFSQADRELAKHSLRRVGLWAKCRQRASTLSGGQQQRVAIARALVQRARLLLADEPIASLDPESSRAVMEILAALNREEGLTVLVSLHQVEYARKYCRRIVALKAGQVAYDGPSSDFSPDLFETVYGSSFPEPLDRPCQTAGPEELKLSPGMLYQAI
jgi:phosphonate transport system ATP-binding protein